jgi:hypothetical protein
VSRIGDDASVQAVTRVNAEQAPKTDDAQADPSAIAGKVDTAGEESEVCTQSLRRGSGEGMYTREARATREARYRGEGSSTDRP